MPTKTRKSPISFTKHKRNEWGRPKSPNNQRLNFLLAMQNYEDELERSSTESTALANINTGMNLPSEIIPKKQVGFRNNETQYVANNYNRRTERPKTYKKKGFNLNTRGSQIYAQLSQMLNANLQNTNTSRNIVRKARNLVEKQRNLTRNEKRNILKKFEENFKND